MKFPHVLGTVSAVAMLSSAAFGWSVSGNVVGTDNKGIADVNINTFNYGGFETTSGADGAFSLSNETDAIGNFGVAASGAVSVQKQGNFLNIANANGKDLKVSLMDALGKVVFQDQISTNIQLDLSKYSQKMMVLRVTSNSRIENYVLSDKGVVMSALMKEGEALPMLQFAKTGYTNKTYQATAEHETGVKVVMEVANVPFNPASSSTIPTPASSSSKKVESSSSAAQVASSSSKVPETVSCVGKTYKSGEHNMSVTVDGKERTFIMRVPAAYKGDKPVPLVVDYHPIGGQSASHMNSSGYKTYSDALGGISLYPQGTTKTMGPGWNVGPCCSYDDDIKFSREMIKKVEELTCIDTKRVYAAGFSMGGGMSNHVACNMSDVFTAVAPAAMDLNTVNSASCAPVRAVPIIMFRGTNDNVCRYQGGDSGFNDGLNFLGAEKNFKFWADKNGCTGSPTTNKDGCQEYSNCKEGSKVVLCTKQGGGHDYGDASIGWPFLYSFEMQ
ncbi:PHB depolymerase family esterase [Fibrobacter sp. UWEL]|uniref:alpha/beta hydrolase family esterase n=1 Tax=Fibrobacter sp. UWEL TaxID=1896209 RepID=UPI000911ED03|nr:PHB depolymerase family esterase [Fibrobacter sp. UWEL]SHL22957.1 polyhydroxybutyrate depolymerase [Fibrobacter sp. UWEL]